MARWPTRDPATFAFLFTEKPENEQYVEHLRSSAGLAVLVGAKEDEAHRVEVGRCDGRLVLQATAPGMRREVSLPRCAWGQ